MFIKSLKAMRLNRRAAPRADEVLEALAVAPGSVVADMGASGGYFSFRFSELVGPEGRVYAVDIDKNFLSLIAKEARRRGVRNIEFLRNGPNGGALPEECADLVFLRNVFHHLPAPPAYMRTLRPAIKPGGRVAIIEWLPRDGNHFTRRHGADPETIAATMTKSGYKKNAEFDFLPEQSFAIYTPHEKNTTKVL